MFDYKRLISRFYPTGFLFLCGLILIIYAALGFLYVQQGVKQKELNLKIANLSVVLSKPLPKKGELKQERDEVLLTLTPISDIEAIATLVNIARDSGIDISEGAGKFLIPSATITQEKIGSSQYRVLQFNNIIVQGDYENIIAFVSNLDSGLTYENIVLTKMVSSEFETVYTGIEEERRTEFRTVKSAVQIMMEDNDLPIVPRPLNYYNGFASNMMGDNPETEETVEGFPDITTTAEQKGYSGSLTPRDGYVLYEHDKLSTENTTSYTTLNYITTPYTSYYYTCESDGTVRQWDGPDISEATEYVSDELTKLESRFTINVNIYTTN